MLHARLLIAALSITSSVAVAAQAVQPPKLNVDVQSFSFAPKPIHLAANQAVTINFINRSGSGHDFTAEKFFRSAKVLAGSAPGGKIELPPHAVRAITLMPAAGRYKAHCGHFLHSTFGMKDEIIVD